MAAPLPRSCVVRSGERVTTAGPGIRSQHCFSFGEHYDPANTRFGALMALNDEHLAVGAGFGLHPHAGVDIVTWVVSGRVLHTGDTGQPRTTGPGDVHVLKAGSGTRHGQFSADDAACHYVQFWLQGDETGRPADQVLTAGAGSPDGYVTRVVQLHHSSAILYAATLAAGEGAALPVAPLLHLYVVSGRVDVEGLGSLEEGDSARLWYAQPPILRATEEHAEVLVWAMPA